MERKAKMQMSRIDKQGANLGRHMDQRGEGAPSAGALSVERLLFSLIEWLIFCSDSITGLKVHTDTEPMGRWKEVANLGALQGIQPQDIGRVWQNEIIDII